MGSQHLVEREIESLRPYAGNARTHSKRQIKQIAASIERFGFTNPVLVSDDGDIIAGHGRVEAARLLGMKRIPTLALSHLSAAERRAYVLADNKLALNAGWDKEILAIELQALVDLEFDVELTGFSLAEIDLVLDEAGEADPDGSDAAEDLVPDIDGQPIGRMGNLWLLGRHRLFCGDTRSAADMDRLMGGERADLVFTDPPYNVAIDGNVCGLGSVRHREFAFASGEMSKPQFTGFLAETLGNIGRVMRDGAIAFICMDWRHMGELLAAGESAFTELKNLVVWNKTNGGMSAFYRSKHELVFVFKQGTAAHTNSFGLGETGRYRTNVWDYAGISSIGGMRAEELAMHPTVKPVALIADAIRDCSRRGEIVLDGFGGSGSTLIAAEKTGRSARLIEYDPAYCDTIIRRWQTYTGKDAILEAKGAPFDDVADERLGRDLEAAE
ncbi:DNA methylase N-4 [Tardibacter chloracetimidivorans]|uniref:site-specific DNA-methyltransferase (adenine-specific) n=1 Tax=Tardibacter chloracetimidivorans TaxID=1921510 RepID=A0A1L3ZQU9_9SPHN|nr:site-specific DNA-methyltransferase [Tardibacter chloracetimidivorans]API57993.1 DNA methylase N-4 [Tardibacter chloracetimidivorans]